MGYWIDRPLLTNVAWRDLYEPNRQETNYLGEVEILKRYEIDGFASLDYLDAYQQKLEWEQKHQLGLTHLLVLPTYLYPDNYESLREYVRSAVKAPQSPRINGKVVIFHYSETEWEPEVLKEMIDRLKQEPDIGDSFLLFGDMPFLEFHGKFAEYAAMGQAPAEDFLERYRRAVRAKLDATDGLALYISIGYGVGALIVAALTLLYTCDWVLALALRLLNALPGTPKWSGRRTRWGESLTRLNAEAKKVLLVPANCAQGLAVSMAKLFVLYSIPYVSLRLIGCTALTFAQAQLLASVMLLITSALPNVAGVGPVEFAFLLLFSQTADAGAASAALVLYRVATYFFPFLLSVIVFLREEKKSLKGFDAQSA